MFDSVVMFEILRGFTLVSYKIIRADYNQFDKHF